MKVRTKVMCTDNRVFFPENELIVSKTDSKGRIQYANSTFCSVSGYTPAELDGVSHAIIRHPWMPRCIFRLMWKTIQAGDPFFCYLVNLCKNGDYYWVFAHMTPSTSDKNKMPGYHSTRRTPKEVAVDFFTSFYSELCAIEDEIDNKEEGIKASTEHLNEAFKGKSYEEFLESF